MVLEQRQKFRQIKYNNKLDMEVNSKSLNQQMTDDAPARGSWKTFKVFLSLLVLLIVL